MKMPIDKLIKKHKTVEAIPDSELLGIGLIRFKGELIRKDTYDALIAKNKEDIFAVPIVQEKIRQPGERLRQIAGKENWKAAQETYETGLKSINFDLDNIFSSEFGSYLSPYFQETMRKRLAYSLEDQLIEDDDGDFLSVDVKVPEMRFLRRGLHYFQSRTDVPKSLMARLSQKLVQRDLDDLDRHSHDLQHSIDSGYVAGEFLEVPASEVDSMINDEGQDFLQQKWQLPKEMREEFESKYGEMGDASFMSYAFRRIILGSKILQSFWEKFI